MASIATSPLAPVPIARMLHTASPPPLPPQLVQSPHDSSPLQHSGTPSPTRSDLSASPSSSHSSASPVSPQNRANSFEALASHSRSLVALAELSSADSGSDSDGPRSPEFSLPMASNTSSENVLRAWSPRSKARNAARINSTSLSPNGAPKRLRSDVIDETTKENDYSAYDSDSDGDGYIRGTVFNEDEADRGEESDELFLTPRRPHRSAGSSGRDRPSPSAASAADEYATFDPILALLDDHWAVLRLGDVDSGDEAQYPAEDRLPPHLAPVTDELRAELFGKDLDDTTETGAVDTRVARELRETERQLMEALRDADALEASRERYAEECTALRTDASTKNIKTRRLERENEAAAREITELNEAMATLTAAHDVDARINDLLIADQAEEIRGLRAKLTATKLTGKMSVTHSSTEPSVSSSISGELTDLESDTDTRTASLEDLSTALAEESSASLVGETKVAHTRARAQSQVKRAKERAKLIERKASLFKEYEKRHSMSIQHVVRRSSQEMISRKQPQQDDKEQQEDPREDGARP